MDVNGLWIRIQDLPSQLYKLSKGEPDAVSELSNLLYTVTGEHLKRNCSYCVNKAYQTLTNYTLEKLIIMANKKYKLKENQVVYFQHNHYTNENLTDAIAEELVAFSPENVDLFEIAPEAKESTADPVLSETEKVTVYKKDKDFFYVKDGETEPQKVTQKLLKSSGVALETVTEKAE